MQAAIKDELAQLVVASQSRTCPATLGALGAGDSTGCPPMANLMRFEGSESAGRIFIRAAPRSVVGAYGPRAACAASTLVSACYATQTSAV